MIDRRHMVAAVACGFGVAVSATRAQSTGKVWRVGYLGVSPAGASPESDRLFAAFIQGLRDSGFVEGKNMILERRAMGGRPAAGRWQRPRGPEGLRRHKCLACHGAKGAGRPADRLAGGIGTLASNAPVRTVGSYWPYATTPFDYVRRAMPITNPLSLRNGEVYAVSAYVLYVNGIVAEDAVLNAQTLPAVRMPNRDGFISDWPPRGAQP